MERPNVVCISIDSARADFCSLTDPTESPLSFVSSLSSEATVFEKAISPSVFTLPVHTSIFTGLFPPEHGIIWEGNTLGDHPTFAELLADQGYSTAAFYKNGWLDSGNILRGFSDLPASLSSAGTDNSSAVSIASKLASVSDRTWTAAKYTYSLQDKLQKWYRKADPSVVDSGGAETVDSINNYSPPADAPFCWFVHFNDAHYGGGYVPPHPYHKSYNERSTLGLAYNQSVWHSRVYGSRIAKREVVAGNIRPPAQEVKTFRNLYRGCLEYCDGLIENIVNILKERNEWENTILVVFGDHGESFGEENVFGHHCSVDDSLLRVPLLIRDPTDTLDSGIVSDPVSLVDLFATILSLTGTEGPKTDSRDLTKESRDYAYAYYDDKGTSTLPDVDLDRLADDLPPQKMYTVWQRPEKKLVWYPNEDTYDGPSSEDENLRAVLQNHLESLTRVDTGDEELDIRTQTQLEDLGYL